VEDIQLSPEQSSDLQEADADSPISAENLQTAVTVATRSKTAQLVSEESSQEEDKGQDLQLQVPLMNRADAVYMGTIYMGSPVSQPARVVFDTGSEFLTLTSVLCDDETAGNYHFKKYDPIKKAFVAKDPPERRCKTMAYNMHNSTSQ